MIRHWTVRERVLHAIGYEGLALLIVIPFATWLLDKPLFDMGMLSLCLSTLAMLWNMLYNALFDRYFPRSVPRGTGLRIGHALGFEGGLLLMALPASAYVLEMSLWQVFLIDMGFFLFYLPYTYVYNAAYDSLRTRLVTTQ